MGRPKGSTNKPKTDAPVVKVKDKTVATVKDFTNPVPLKKKRIADETPLTTDYIVAVTELAMIAGRDYYLGKLEPWVKTHVDTGKYTALNIKVEENKINGIDIFRLFDGEDLIDMKHVFKVDVEDVIRGPLGAR